MTRETIQQAHIIISGIEPLRWQPDKSHAPFDLGSHDPDADSHIIHFDQTTQELFFSPLMIAACAREAAHSLKSEQRTQVMGLAESLSILQERLIIERSVPETAPADSRAIAYRLAESTSRKATHAGDDRVAAQEWHMSFRIQWEETIATYHDVWALFDYIGKWIGIGSGRESGYGRFVVHVFSIEVVDRPATA